MLSCDQISTGWHQTVKTTKTTYPD